MKRCSNCEIQAGNISLRLNGGITVYKVYGYAFCCTDEMGRECIELQPADLRKKPVMVVPKANVASVVVEF